MPSFTLEFECEFSITCETCGRDISDEANITSNRKGNDVSIKCPHCIKDHEKDLEEKDEEIESLNNQMDDLKEEIEALKIEMSFNDIMSPRLEASNNFEGY